jgi:hypothetical protein
MPFALGTTLEAIPARIPYLRAVEGQAAAWQTRLAAMDGLGHRIGLVWAGNPLAAADRRRSMPPERLAPLFGIPGLQFFSLQKGTPAAPGEFPLASFMDGMDDFADTAALVACLDLVISVDTAAAHLAAALGRPVWLLDRFDACWRWLEGRSDSPWYHGLHIYRQPRPGDWDSVIAAVVHDLRSGRAFSRAQ